ncbi:MAG: sigma-70 family RNA polymerase sigma factor [Chloroflexi bacterium]|nr:sigma-70 family RNA polymerase sigma factor [Chloroflexota bacterium]
MNEEALVERAQRGDVQAYNQLVLAYQQVAYNVAYRVLGDEERAMDATQDAFFKGYRALLQFRGGSFKAWILRIVINACYDQLRHRQRRPQTPLDDLIENDEHSRLFEDPADSPENVVERQEFDAVIQTALDTLPEDQRVTVIMSDIEGMSYEEIAAATSVALGTVKSRLSRGRARLRDFFREHQELLPSYLRLSAEFSNRSS